MRAVFFYGLFMDAALLRGRGLHPANERRALVRDMALRIGKRATLVAEPGGIVHGVVMDLPEAELRGLYAEPSVADYRAETVTAELAEGGSVPALCFNLPPSDRPVEANPAYVEQLRALARRLGLPAEYVGSIQ